MNKLNVNLLSSNITSGKLKMINCINVRKKFKVAEIVQVVVIDNLGDIVDDRKFLLSFNQEPFAVSVKKKQQPSGRKRWGAGLSDTWDDWDEFDFNSSPKKNTSKHIIPPIGNKPKFEPKKPSIMNKENDDDDDDFLS